MKEFWLTDEEMENVIDYWWKTKFGLHCDGCLCGYYECKVKDDLYITIDTTCRKSSGCPYGMDYVIDEEIKVYNESVESYGCTPDNKTIEELKEHNKDKGISLKLLGKLNQEQSKELRKVARRAFARDYKNYLDEYGEDIRDQDINNENMKFGKEVECIYKSIKNSFHIEGMLLNYVERNEFKLAIQKGIDDYEKNR